MCIQCITLSRIREWLTDENFCSVFPRVSTAFTLVLKTCSHLQTTCIVQLLIMVAFMCKHWVNLELLSEIQVLQTFLIKGFQFGIEILFII